MNPNGILDNALTFIYKINGLKLGSSQLIFELERFHVSINKALLSKKAKSLDYSENKEILEKLVKDGYLDKPKGYDDDCYSKTFEGRWFIYQGGYLMEEELLNQERNWKLFVEKKTVENSNKLNLLTLILAVGTSIAAFYYLLEISKNQIASLPFWTAVFLFLSLMLIVAIIWLIIQQIRQRKK